MQRQDQGRIFGNAQSFGRHHDALLLQLGNLVDQGLRIDHHAVADDRKLALSNDAGRQQRKLVGRAVDDQGVAGIMAALETHNDVGLLRQPVDDLAFAFVAPLGSDNHDIRHQDPFPAPAPGHLKPGATGQVHLRIKEALLEASQSPRLARHPPDATTA